MGGTDKVCWVYLGFPVFILKGARLPLYSRIPLFSCFHLFVDGYPVGVFSMDEQTRSVRFEKEVYVYRDNHVLVEWDPPSPYSYKQTLDPQHVEGQADLWLVGIAHEDIG